MSRIEVHGLTKRYGAKAAVDDLSFEVNPGVVTGFLGPNAEWLPYDAGNALMRVGSTDEAVGRLAGGVVFAVFVAVVIAIGTTLTQRRDA